MKKIKLIIVVLMLIAAIPVFTQPIDDPCYPDCPESLWSYPQTWHIDNITLSDGTVCTGVDIRYRCRIACNTWFDIYIADIYVNDVVSQNFELELLINELVLQLLIANPCGFPPLQAGDPCETGWRVLKGGCWWGEAPCGVSDNFFAPITNFHEVAFQCLPCIPDDCCLESFTVCIDRGTGDRIITSTGFEPPTNCNPQDMNICVPVCGSIYSR